MKSSEPLRYEDAAEPVTVAGWQCVRCKRFFFEESSARWCCHTDGPCKECGGRNLNKSYRCCQACREKHEDARWHELLATKAVAWDGETPLCMYQDDKFFFSPDEVEEYLHDQNGDLEEGDPPRKLEDLQLCLCEASEPNEFELADFLSDHLPEDYEGGDHGFDEIDKVVNDFIKSLAPLSYYGTNTPVTLESLRKFVSEEPQ